MPTARFSNNLHQVDRYPQNQKIGKPNDVKSLDARKPKESKQDSQNRLRLAMSVGGDLLLLKWDNLMFSIYKNNVHFVSF